MWYLLGLETEAPILCVFIHMFDFLSVPSWWRTDAENFGDIERASLKCKPLV